MNPKSIGVIGVGAMGMSVAESLLRAGYKTDVRDIVADRMTQAEKLGAVLCSSPEANDATIIKYYQSLTGISLPEADQALS